MALTPTKRRSKALEPNRTRSKRHSKTRAQTVRATLSKKRAALRDEWHPCMWCGAPIPQDRVKTALLLTQAPKYCDDKCRRNEPQRSLVFRIEATVLGIGKGDEKAWKHEFDERLAYALRPVAKGRAK